MRLFFLYLLASCLLFQNCTEAKRESTADNNAEAFYTDEDFKTVEKIDAHVHVNSSKPDYVQQATEDNFRLITINWDDVNEPPPMEEQQQFALHQVKAFLIVLFMPLPFQSGILTTATGNLKPSTI